MFHLRIMILLAALFAITVNGAAIASMGSPESTPTMSVDQRDTQIPHNFALVCANDRPATNWCMNMFAVTCDARGRKIWRAFDHTCDALCYCVDLAPKPVCLFGLSGQSYCNRAVHYPSTSERVENADTVVHDDSSTNDFGVNGLDERSGPIATRCIIPEADCQPPPTVIGKQRDAFVNPPSVDCSRDGYNRHSADTLKVSILSDTLQSDDYEPIGDFLKYSSILDVCARNSDFHVEDEKDIDGSLKRDISPFGVSVGAREIQTVNIPHNYAMVCASDRQETTFCQQDGYFCDSNGKINIPAVPNKYCSDYCVCIDVGLKAHCMMADSGAMYCLRTEHTAETASLPTPFDTSINQPGSRAERAEEQDNFDDDIPEQASTDQAQDQAQDQGVAAWPSNDMAMVCWDDKDLTNFCAQDYGYYCSSSGKIVRQADGVLNRACEANCVCIDLQPKPNCIMNLVGGAQCARNEANENVLEPADIDYS